MSNRPIIEGPLTGIKILDFSRLLPGPMASMFLADMGAEVIRVEDPHHPDYIKEFLPKLADSSAYYYALNRNKQSLAVDYRTLRGKEIIHTLVEQADVVIEQFRPGTMKRYGLDYETLSKINSKLIYASITGFGQNSSKSQEAGHDLNYLAMAGLLDGCSIPKGQIADVAGGAYMTMNALLAALIQSSKSGQGQHLDIAMTDCILPIVTLPFAETQTRYSTQDNFQLSGKLARYNIYQCADKKWIALAALEDKFWINFCKKIDHIEWIPAGIEQQESIKQHLQNIFIQKTSQEWVDFFKGVDVCLNVVNELDDLAADEYLNEKKLFIDHKIDGQSFLSIDLPVRFKSQEAKKNWVAPKLGEDTITILRGLSLSEDEILSLEKELTIKACR
jgi:alpha-methylacyl-CoA racemase